ncbi:MAG: single-stranded DNA-binding protein [Patescibacteria group bacterium]
MDLNKAMIIGRMTQDPELRTIPSGHSVVSFGLATNRKWKGSDGQMQEKADFHNIVAWRGLAETIAKYTSKGSRLYIEGRLETRTWEDQNGVKKYRTEIIADSMIMLDSKKDASPSSQESAPQPKVNNSDEEISVEDIPF